jgi:tetratricopeptide (TPR) repeat protein
MMARSKKQPDFKMKFYGDGGLMRVSRLTQRICGAALVLTAGTVFAQSDDGLRYKVNYQCNGEKVQVSYCRHDSDTADMPRTAPQNDYCLVYYPDRPKRGGLTVQAAELRGDVVGKLQSCGALASPQGQASAQNTGAQSSTPTPTAAAAPSTADSYYQQGLQYANAKQFSQAADALKNSIAIRPTAQAYGALGLVYFNLKDDPNAIAAFQQSVKLAPNVPEYQYDLGFLYYANHQYSQGVDPLREAIRLKPGLADPHVALGATDVALAKLDDAMKVYRALQKVDQDKANKLYLDITKVDLDAKSKAKPSATTRAEAYKNLDVATLQAKATKGDDAAMKRLADVYYAQKDSASGLKWTIAAAERGDPELQNGLGWQYQNATPKDVVQARKWYRKAGEQGLDTAQLNLCQSYATQFGLDQGVISGAGKDDTQSPITPVQASQDDVDDAYNWCEKAADQGLYLAEWYMGVLNAKGGPNHPTDYSEAYFWLTTGGLKSAAVFLQKVGKHLTDAQRAEIEKRATNFHPDPMELLHDVMTNGSQQN